MEVLSTAEIQTINDLIGQNPRRYLFDEKLRLAK
jgi:hypothetical protein